MTDPHHEGQPVDDADSTDVHANLAFMRSLVTEGPKAQMSGGAAFFTAGVCYGLQCLVQAGGVLGWYPLGPLGNLLAAILPTVIFMIVLGVILWRERKEGQKGVATRALNAAFGSAGLANLFMVFVFGYNAIAEKNITIWFYYPAVVCAFQGAVWYIAYMIRRKLWLAFVSAGWFLTTVALGLLIHSPYYVLVIGFALLFLMGGSGYTMMYLAKKQA